MPKPNRFIRVKAVAIGECILTHEIRTLPGDTDINKTAAEFFKRQYPRKKNLCDFSGEDIQPGK